jgi:membrane-associated phospholipid phosphatase
LALSLPADSLSLSEDESTIADSASVPVAVPAGQNWLSMVTNLPSDWRRAFESVTGGENLVPLLGLTAITLDLLAVDQGTYRVSDGLYNSSTRVHRTTDFFISIGDGRSQFILAGGFAAHGLIFSDERSLRTAQQSVEAVLATGILVQVLKRISGRESPEVATTSTGKWTPFPNLKTYHQRQSSYYAFPSGHIATTMAAVTVVSENYPEVSWIRPVGYALVGLVGISLVNRGYHWYSDLPLGIAVGYTFGMIASHPERDDGSAASNSSSLVITPSIHSSGGGIQVSLAF